MRHKYKIIIIVVAFIAALLAGWFSFHFHRPSGPITKIPEPNIGTGTLHSDSSNNAHGENMLRTAEEELKAATTPDTTKHAMALLKGALTTGSTNEISAAIRRLLDEKLDAPTGQGFKVGKHGFLTEAPTFRSFLLDYLAQIDPAAAAAYAPIILKSKDSPDEWALALRNLALGDNSGDARSFLTKKTDELLTAKDWQNNPSAGYLEAFDTAVFLGGTNLVPALTGMVSLQDNPAIAHAAFLALDRLVMNDPATLLSALLDHPELMPGRDQARADYFARANASDPRQVELLQNYLLSPSTSAAEKEQFAGIFPNANFMVSQNLLTPSEVPSPADIKTRDAAALKVVQQWLNDGRFEPVRPVLEKIQIRLQDFAHQAAQQP